MTRSKNQQKGYRNIKIHIWLRGSGKYKKRNHLKAQQWTIHFFCFIPQASEPTMNLNLSKLVYSLNYKEMYGDQSAE